MVEIKLTAIEKNYATVKAVRGLSFTVQAGKIFALLGPNGAGKSSLIRMLVGLTLPDAGQIEVRFDQQILSRLPESSFAYLPEDRGLYPDKTVTENLQYIGRLRGMPMADIKTQLEIWLPRLDLVEKAKDNLAKLSKGNQQKVQLISCLMHKPKLLVLDEPFSGLDPINQEHVVEILSELRDAGTTIVLSAHQMALVERLADSMLLLNKGQQVALGNLEQVIEQLSPAKQFSVKFASKQALDTVQACPSIQTLEVVDEGFQFVLTPAQDLSVNDLLRDLMAIGEVQDFGRQRLSLHELYLSAVQQHNQMNSVDTQLQFGSYQQKTTEMLNMSKVGQN